MMAGLLAAAGLGRVCGAFLGTYIWSMGGIKIVGLLSALFCALAFVSLVIGLRGFKAPGAHAASD
jgi:hypothetical protein